MILETAALATNWDKAPVIGPARDGDVDVLEHGEFQYELMSEIPREQTPAKANPFPKDDTYSAVEAWWTVRYAAVLDETVFGV